MHSHGARAWREVGSEAAGLGVCGIVVRFWARLEYEDAKVGVCRCETAGDDAASGAAYQMFPLVRRKMVEEEVGDDGAPPAMMISYSSLILVGADIVYLLSPGQVNGGGEMRARLNGSCGPF
jgi:hypothetical protein